MITSSRSSKLNMRLKQIEATVPSIQKKVIAQTNHIQFAYTGGSFFFCLVSLDSLLYCLVFKLFDSCLGFTHDVFFKQNYIL